VGLIHDIPTVKELFGRIISEAKDILKRLAADRTSPSAGA